MSKELDDFYLRNEEPVRSCLLALSTLILRQDQNISTAWKYGMPFFCYQGKMFCYLWVHKKLRQPYIGIMEGKRIDHPDLILEKRTRIKIILFDPEQDLPIDTIETILNQAVGLYKSGIIKIGK